MTNTIGLAEQMAVSYSPMGSLRQSAYESQSYNLSLNIFTLYGYQWSRTLETDSSDALGNVLTRNVIAYTGSAQSPTLIDVPPRLFGGSGSWNRPGTRTSVYQPGIGRLAKSFTNDTRDTLRYDASGNTTVQQATDTLNTSGATDFEASERVMYYDANERLVAVDSRRGPTGGTGVDQNKFYMVFDEYRYDALGRRVFSRSQRACPPTSSNPDYYAQCSLAYVQRTVWDGQREMYEIRMPDRSTYWEKDNLAVADSIGIANQVTASSKYVDLDPHFGRVGYVYGGAIDRPLVVMRMDYTDHAMGDPAYYNPKAYYRFQSFALYPQWDIRGEPAIGSTADGGVWRCEGTGASQRCTNPMAWSAFWSPYGVKPDLLAKAWAGSLVQDKRDASGLMFRRNRYLDPGTGRFTQPDPMGLGGGLNSYGYAAGDPVNYSDPFGLTTCDWCKRLISWAKSQIENPTPGTVAMIGMYQLQSSAEEAVTDGFAAMENQSAEETLVLVESAIGTAAAKGVHGNSKLSTAPQHGYGLYNGEGILQKWGISGSALNRNGTSPRGNRQANALNRESDGGFYCVVFACFANRGLALDWERSMVREYQAANNGRRPPLQKRP